MQTTFPGPCFCNLFLPNPRSSSLLPGGLFPDWGSPFSPTCPPPPNSFLSHPPFIFPRTFHAGSFLLPACHSHCQLPLPAPGLHCSQLPLPPPFLPSLSPHPSSMPHPLCSSSSSSLLLKAEHQGAVAGRMTAKTLNSVPCPYWSTDASATLWSNPSKLIPRGGGGAVLVQSWFSTMGHCQRAFCEIRNRLVLRQRSRTLTKTRTFQSSPPRLPSGKWEIKITDAVLITYMARRQHNAFTDFHACLHIFPAMHSEFQELQIVGGRPTCPVISNWSELELTQCNFIGAQRAKEQQTRKLTYIYTHIYIYIYIYLSIIRLAGAAVAPARLTQGAPQLVP